MFAVWSVGCLGFRVGAQGFKVLDFKRFIGFRTWASRFGGQLVRAWGLGLYGLGLGLQA